MRLEAILARIRETGEAQAAAIRDKAESEAQALVAEARVEAGQLYQQAYRAALEAEPAATARIRNQASFEAACLIGEARDRLVADTLEQLEQMLRDIRRCPAYPAALKRMLREMLPGQNGMLPLSASLILEASPLDRDLLETLLCELGLDLQVEYTLTGWGGLNARSPDGSIHIVNTLESRLEQALPYLKQRLAAWFDALLPAEQQEAPAHSAQGMDHGL